MDVRKPGSTLSPDKKLTPETKEAEKPLTFEQSNLGQTVKTAQDLQKNPEALAKRRNVRKPRKPEDKPDRELLEESADKLADAKRIKVEDLPDGRKAVEVDLDLSKTKDLSGFGADVKSMSISVSTKQPDGTEKGGDVKIVTRGVHNGKIGYFYRDEKGEMHEFVLPMEGIASIKIGPDDYEKWDQGRVLVEMKKEMKEAATQIAAKTARREASDEMEDDLTIAPLPSPTDTVSHGVSATYVRGNSSRSPRVEPNPSPVVPTSSPVAPIPSPESDDHSQEVARAGSRVLKYPVSPEGMELIKSFNPNEDFVDFKDQYREKDYKLRETVHKCFELARRFAREKGFDIKVISAFRDPGTQARLYAESSQPGKMVAAPGRSWHQAGSAVDVHLVRADDPDGRSITTVEAKDFLEECMNKAGFVRYSVEWWHFEVGSYGWLEMMKEKGLIAGDVKPYERQTA